MWLIFFCPSSSVYFYNHLAWCFTPGTLLRPNQFHKLYPEHDVETRPAWHVLPPFCCLVIIAVRMYHQLRACGRQSRGTMTFGVQWATAPWKTKHTRSSEVQQCFLHCHSISGHTSVWPALQPPRAPVCLQTTNRLQHLLQDNIPTPTLQKNMHVISYAQCSLKIVCLWCKVRTKLDRLSTAHSRWFFFPSFKLPPSFLLSGSILFARKKSHYMPTEWVSDRKRERGRITVTIQETDRVSQKKTVVVLCPFLFISCGRPRSCQMHGIIWQLSDLFECDKILCVSFPIMWNKLHKIQSLCLKKISPYLSACHSLSLNHLLGKNKSENKQNAPSLWKSA